LTASSDTPRYRYLGELVGEPNFLQGTTSKSTLTTVFNWIVGLFESYTPVMLQRPQHGTVSDSGRIYVVDTGRNAVVGFDPNPPAEDDSKNKEGHMLIWEMADKNTRFAGPVAVAMVWNGEIAVSDAILGVVVRLNNKGEPIGHLGAGQIKRPTCYMTFYGKKMQEMMLLEDGFKRRYMLSAFKAMMKDFHKHFEFTGGAMPHDHPEMAALKNLNSAVPES